MRGGTARNGGMRLYISLALHTVGVWGAGTGVRVGSYYVGIRNLALEMMDAWTKVGKASYTQIARDNLRHTVSGLS